jgi:hypothetical protein
MLKEVNYMTTSIPLNYTEQLFVAKQIITQKPDNIACQLQVGADIDLDRLVTSLHATVQAIDFLWSDLTLMPGHMTTDPAACKKNPTIVRMLGEVDNFDAIHALRKQALSLPVLQQSPHINLDIVKYKNSYVLILAAPHMLFDGIATYLFLSNWFQNYKAGTAADESFKPPKFQISHNIYSDFADFLPELQDYCQDSELLTIPPQAFDSEALSEMLVYALPETFEVDLRQLAKKHGACFQVTLLGLISRAIHAHLANDNFSLRYNRHGRRTQEQRTAFRFLLEDPVLKINTHDHALPQLVNQIQRELDYFDSKPRMPLFMPQSLIMEHLYPEAQADVAAMMAELNLPASAYVKPEIMRHYGHMLKNMQQAVKPQEDVFVHVNITPSILLAKPYASKARRAGIDLQSISFDFNHDKFRELHIFITRDVNNQWHLIAKSPIKHVVLKDMVEMILGEIRSKTSDVIMEASKQYPQQLSA